jgi:predicted PurR-regulated permease PerM
MENSGIPLRRRRIASCHIDCRPNSRRQRCAAIFRGLSGKVDMSQEKFNQAFVLLLLLLISAVFLAMVRPFLMTVIMAGIFSALTRPLYRRMGRRFGGRSSLAAALTLLLVIFGVLLPLAGLTGAVTGEAIKVGETVKPWVQKQLSQPAEFSSLLEKMPFYESILPYKEAILMKAGELVGRLSSFLISSLSSVTVMTAQFIFMLFIFLYTMFFFLVDGERFLNWIVHYLPLKQEDEERMLDKFTSVTRATLKGVAVVGILQGALTGAAFAVIGIPSAIFWGTVTAVMSLVPGIGTAIVWLPASIILASNGSYGRAIGLFVFCSLVVGGLDNFLRPRLVGQDTRMHPLMVLFGTLGGIMMFGAAGIIVGPIVAALVVTVWEIYGVAFRESLPRRTPPFGPAAPEPPDERILLAQDEKREGKSS